MAMDSAGTGVGSDEHGSHADSMSSYHQHGRGFARAGWIKEEER